MIGLGLEDLVRGFHQGTKGRLMKWLIWREYRANRLVMIVGAVLLLVPYVFLLSLAGLAPSTAAGRIVLGARCWRPSTVRRSLS